MTFHGPVIVHKIDWHRVALGSVLEDSHIDIIWIIAAPETKQICNEVVAISTIQFF